MDLPRLAISIRQPWLWAITDLDKRVENRSTPWKYRGPVWLHASRYVKRVFDEESDMLDYTLEGYGMPDRCPDYTEIEHGGIVGRAQIVDLLSPTLELSRRKWHVPGLYGLVLDDVRTVPFVACAGALGLWKVPDKVLDQLRRVA